MTEVGSNLGGDAPEQGSDARDSSPDFGALRARSRRRFLVFGGGGLALALAAGGFALWSQQRAARREVENAIDGLRTCLLGGPLDAKESVALRVRRLQLRAIDRTDTELVTGGDKIWPFSCRQPSALALAAIKESASEPQQQTLTALNAFLNPQTAVSRDASAVTTAVVATLDALHPSEVGKASEPLPAAALNVDSLAAIAPLSSKGASFSSTYTEDNPGLSLPVLIDDQDLPSPILCRFQEALAAQCHTLGELSAVHGHGLRLLGTSDPEAPNLIFAGNRGAEGVFVAGSSTPIDRVYSYGGYSAKGGSVAVLGYDEAAHGMVLVQKSGSSATVRTPLKPNFRVGNYFYGSQLLWDQVLVRGVTPDDERRLFTLPLDKKDKNSFDLADIGELPEPGLIRDDRRNEPHLNGCRTEQATVVRVRGYDHDFLTFRINGAFSMPVTANTDGVLGCYGSSATLVAVSKASPFRVQHETCSSAGCNMAIVNEAELDHETSELRIKDAGAVAAVDLAGKLLVVWLAGERGGLRFRMAAPEGFAQAPDTLVFDDHVAEGKVVDATTVLGFRLYSRANFAVLLLSTLAGVHAFRIDANGAIAPFAITMQD
jgi:hypothetical protein